VAAADIVLAPEIQVLAERVLVVERRIDERFHVLKESTALALASNEKRLDGMNAFREALSDQVARSMTRLETEASLSTLNNQLSVEIGNLREKLDQAMKPPYVIWGLLFSIALAGVSGVWMVTTLKIEASTTPAMLGLQAVNANQEVQDKRLASLEISARASESEIGTLRVQITRLNVWADFLHARGFPEQPGPPMKQP
jgi:hypothetical protein